MTPFTKYCFRFLAVLLIIGLHLLTQSNVVVYEFFTNSNSSNLNNNTDSSGEDGMLPDNKTEVHYAIVLCKGDGPPKMAEFQVIVEQLKVLFKSAAVLTSTVITFNIISNSEEVYKELIDITTGWPTEYSQRLIFPPMKKISYPPEFQHLMNLFKPCSTGRLFLLDILEDLDAVIYLDTDTYFMQPPEDLWAEFKHFDHRQVIGFSPHARYYLKKPNFNKFPIYGSGANAGVLLMNLTRMKIFPKGWHASIKNILKSYKLSMFGTGDQDILNIFFSGENGVYVYEVGCEWDYGRPTCFEEKKINLCPEAASKGIALLHCKIQQIKGIYGAWMKFDLRSPVKELMVLMEDGVEHHPNELCIKMPNATDIILKGIKRRFTSIL